MAYAQLMRCFDSPEVQHNGIRDVRQQLRKSSAASRAQLFTSVPDCREKSLAQTAVQEAMLWAIRAVELNQHKIPAPTYRPVKDIPQA